MPIQLELRVTSGTPIYRGHDHYWSVIRDLAKTGDFSRHEIEGRSNDRDGKCIADYLKRLELAGFILSVEPSAAIASPLDRKSPKIYRLIKRQVNTPSINRDGTLGKLGSGQLHMWNAMRSLPRFNSMELSLAATTQEISVQKATALGYARHLQDAGYLQILRPGGPNVQRIWRLKPSMDTGPRPPKILRCKAVYDVNKGRIMGTQVAEEVAA